ncbi:MAG: FAD-binding oxidoreductase [Pseudomonadota bacterium]
MKLSGWGRYPVIEAKVYTPRRLEDLKARIASTPSLIARGNGRAYGDSAINPQATLRMTHFNRMIAFDPATGQLEVETGVTLGEIIKAFLPRGWFPMISPGTKFVTVGGAIAADVHGKNHHKDGSFRTCVDWIDVLDAEGNVQRCSPTENARLFDYTLGGMGLTGIILRAAIRLRPVETGWLRQTTLATPDLHATIQAFEAGHDATYSVAWIDCLGRGASLGRSLVMLGEHAALTDLPPERADKPFDIEARRALSVPVEFPSFALNRFSLQAFNALYYRMGARRKGEQLVNWDAYFYPLDAIHGWNKIYGRKGFAQYQCVLPLDRSEAGLTCLLEETEKAGAGSFLAVLKRFGVQDSAFSFPMEGYTLALDFPVTPKTKALLERLDRITLDHGGRFYLAKDSRMTAKTFQASEERLAAFEAFRSERSMARRFCSAQAERLGI